MKKMTLIVLMGTTLFGTSTQAAELIININHVKNDDGKIYAQVFKGNENFENGVPAGQTMMNAKEGPAKITFGGLTAGDYVVRLFHDQNDNQKLDQNMFGMPTEGYAFSNEAAPNFGPPSYQDMVVTIGEDDATVTTKAKMFY